MGAGGGKTSKGTSSSPFAPLLASFGMSAAQPFKLLTGQTAEALQTGGANAQIPIINRSADAARSALSQSTKTTQEALARSGLSGSAFGQQILADLSMKGGEDIAAIGPNAAQQFISGASGVTGQGIGALGTAGGLTRKETSTKSFWDIFNEGLAATAGPAAFAFS
jgi:hypothetical protein